jgi:hypothetical protein
MALPRNHRTKHTANRGKLGQHRYCTECPLSTDAADSASTHVVFAFENASTRMSIGNSRGVQTTSSSIPSSSHRWNTTLVAVVMLWLVPLPLHMFATAALASIHTRTTVRPRSRSGTSGSFNANANPVISRSADDVLPIIFTGKCPAKSPGWAYRAYSSDLGRAVMGGPEGGPVWVF